ncbi:MAG: putative Ig domain-containing protein, partial [Synergistaceae bacterium]|nr:putative Ig domain-containing protein [Synergistaceae bacterium]
MPTSGTLATTQKGTEPFAGYHTITLNDSIKLTNGEYFSVVVKFSTEEMPVEVKESKYSDNATIEKGSFVSWDGKSWSARANDNVCIRAFTTTASDTAPKIITSSLPDGFLKTAYNQQLFASGSKPLKWEFSDGKMPSGLAISSLGILSGTPKEAGDFTFTITVKNENTGASDSKTYKMSVIDKPEITTSKITGYIGYALNETLKLASGTAKSWSITSGKLPSGLKFNESTGAITGKPTAKGEFSITFKAIGSSWEVSKNITIEIEAKPTKPTISTSKLTDGEIEEEYSAELKISGTEPINLSVEGLPAGLSMNSSGEFSGTPTVAGTFTMKVTATNIFTELSKTTVTKNVKLKIAAKDPIFEDFDEEDLPMAIVGKEFAGYKFNLSAGTEPITWTASGLPSGLTLNSSGELSGTPKKAGKFNITIKAKNLASTTSLKIPLVVYQVPSITTTKLSSVSTGKKYTAKLKAAGTTPITKWEIEGLPDTLTYELNAKGDQATISGTPTSADTYNLSITATNAAGTSATKNLTLTVNGVKPKLTASLPKAEVGASYTDSKISATGTLPIEISYSIAASDKTKFGISDLSDLGLSFSSNNYDGTAEITGEPKISIKSLPITITAKNVAGTVTKKLSFTAKGEKPSFESSTPTAV